VTRRVLVADDQADVRRMLILVLRRKGWEVDDVASGEEALAALDEAGTQVDAVVLDHRMTGITGMEAADRLIAAGIDVPIVIFSAYLDPDLEAEADRLGVRTLAKTEVNELPETLERLADEHDPRSGDL
jgi:CheY-like chemotaxis protein